MPDYRWQGWETNEIYYISCTDATHLTNIYTTTSCTEI